jgi:hypothetical protein
MIELVTDWPRKQTDRQDLAIRSYPSHQVRCVTQNLKKPSSVTHDVLSLRANNIFADTIWIAIDYRSGTGISDFTHRINLRRFDNEDGRWEGWLMLIKTTRSDQMLSTLPADANMSLDKGLQLIRDTEPPSGQVRPGIITREIKPGE